jgi:hypothetical protein
MNQIVNRFPSRLRGLLGCAALAVAGIFSASGCAMFGFNDRVLCRVPSPTGLVVAVCQEVPEFDGPGYDIRLERPDGTVLRRLYRIGDGDGCSEIAWAPDGCTLAVLTGHVARVRFVDVAWALDHLSVETSYWSWRQVDFSTDRRLVSGRNLRFVGPLEIELRLCPSSPDEGRWAGEWPCTEAAVERRLRIPMPIVTGHQTAAAVQ